MHYLQSTDRRRKLISDYIDMALVNLTTGQRLESFLCDNETRASSINSSHVDRHARRWVGQAPARAAVRRVPHDIKGAADERERWYIAERRESRGEPIQNQGNRYMACVHASHGDAG
jgi:hypothetical protein